MHNKLTKACCLPCKAKRTRISKVSKLCNYLKQATWYKEQRMKTHIWIADQITTIEEATI